jgi:hypothetical protein
MGRVFEHDVAVLASKGHEIDDALWQASFLEHLHNPIVGQEHRARRLPQDDVAHHSRRGGQIAADGVEVERRNRQYKPLQRTPVKAVDLASRLIGLLNVEKLQVIGVKAPEIDELGQVDLGLEGGLRLIGHNGRDVFDRAGPGQQVGGAVEDRRPLVPVQPCPGLLSVQRRLDRPLELLSAFPIVERSSDSHPSDLPV